MFLGKFLQQKYLIVFVIYDRYLRHDAQSMLREREGRGKGRGNNSCHFSDQYFLPCFLCKHPLILSRNMNRYFNIKIRLLIRET